MSLSVLYGVFKKKEVITLGGFAFFPENVNENKLTLMVGDNLNKMDMIARKVIKCNTDEVVLRKVAI